MKKLGILCLISLMSLTFTACSDAAQVLKGYKEQQTFSDDDQDYEIYTYDSSADSEFDSDENYKEVKSENTEELKGFFKDFNDWAKISSFNAEYKIDDSIITEGDRYSIADSLVDDSGSGIRKLTRIYKKYDIYYYDKETHTLYRIHNDLTIQ